MSTIEKSGILSKSIVCTCKCKFKIEKDDIKEVEPAGPIISFFIAIGIYWYAKSYFNCPECKRKLYLR